MLLTLYIEFFKTGLFAVGGGLATLPFLYDLSDRYGWYSYEQLADMIAVSESTPGAIGVNMATYAGFSTAGVPGAIIATLGLVSPSIIVIIILAHVLERFKQSTLVQGAFYGLRPASTALIAAAGFNFMYHDLINTSVYSGLQSLMDVINIKALIFSVVLYVIMQHRLFKHLHPVVFIAFSAIIGILFSF